MPEQEPRCYVRWDGQKRKGAVRVGKFQWDLDRIPFVLKAMRFFDLWFEPGLQEEIRMRPSDQREDVTSDQRDVLVAYVKSVGDWARSGQDVVEG